MSKNKKFEELLEDNYDDGDSKIDNKINLKESDESNEENEAWTMLLEYITFIIVLIIIYYNKFK